MQPKDVSAEERQAELFRSRLDQILNLRHPLCVLAGRIDWAAFDRELGALYAQDRGRPGLPTRLMVGLHYLKHAFNESDESVVERFLENGYWQYFCGFEHFLHALPLDPSSLVRWRKRVGAEGIEKLLVQTIETAKRAQLIVRGDVERVNVDTTSQEKAIAFPTDARLYDAMRARLIKEAKQRGIVLRQSYTRLSKNARWMQSRYAHAKQMKRARRELRRLRRYLGCVLRDIQRKCPEPDDAFATSLQMAERLWRQKQSDSHKLYSLHAPEVECLAKGKAHKRYEFGCKVSVVTASRRNWVLDIEALHGNPYDGKTLARALAQTQQRTGLRVEDAFCDRGYRGKVYWPDDVRVWLAGRTRLPRALKRCLKRRNAIEPVIGHLKSDHRMQRNFLLGRDGDRINALLAGAAFNFKKLLTAFLCPGSKSIQHVSVLISQPLKTYPKVLCAA